MHATVDQSAYRSPFLTRLRLEPDALGCLIAPPPACGMIVRDAGGDRIGRVKAVIMGESGALVAIDVVCRGGVVRRLQAHAVRCFGDGVVSFYFRRDVMRFPGR